jgi:hypothetical protein
MEKPMSNAKSARTPTLQELFNENKSLLLLLQVQVNNWLMLDKSMTTPINKYLQHQPLLSSGATTIHLVSIDYVQETSSGISNEMASSLQLP